MVTPSGFGAATGPTWIGCRSPTVLGARLQRGRFVAFRRSSGPPACPASSAASTPLTFPASNSAMSCSFWALAATAALLPISILLICSSRSKFRKLDQAFTVECFDDILLFVPLLAPAAS